MNFLRVGKHFSSCFWPTSARTRCRTLLNSPSRRQIACCAAAKRGFRLPISPQLINWADTQRRLKRVDQWRGGTAVVDQNWPARSFLLSSFFFQIIPRGVETTNRFGKCYIIIDHWLGTTPFCASLIRLIFKNGAYLRLVRVSLYFIPFPLTLSLSLHQVLTNDFPDLFWPSSPV